MNNAVGVDVITDDLAQVVDGYGIGELVGAFARQRIVEWRVGAANVGEPVKLIVAAD